MDDENEGTDSGEQLGGLEAGDEDEYLEHGEKVWKVSDVEKWEKDYGNDTAWTKKHTELSQRLREEERDLGEMKQLKSYLASHPEKFEAVKKMLTESVGANQADDTMRQIEKAREDVSMTAAEIRLEREMDSVRKKHSSYFDSDPEFGKKLARHAYDKDLPSLEVAFRDMMFDSEAENRMKRKADEEKKAKETSRRLAVPAGSKGDGKSGAKKYKFGDPDFKKAMMDDPAWNEE